MTSFNESIIEDAALAWLESLGWTVMNGPEIAPGELLAERRDYGQVVLEQRPRQRVALARLNPDLPAEAIDDAFRKVTRPEGPTLEARNRSLHRLLVDGVTVEYRHADGRVARAQARVIDFDDPANNDWLAVNQFTVIENKHNRRPDVVLFINGLPLVLVELKNAADEEATIWTAFWQLQTYKAELPTLFAYNALLVVSDGVEARVGTLTAGQEWFKPWRTIAGENLADPHLPELQVMLEGVFDKRRLLDLIGYFIVFEDYGDGRLAKKMAGYHQFHAVNFAVTETLRAGRVATAGMAGDGRGVYQSRRSGGKPGDRRIGVVLWHTQGSGKSLTMAFYAGRGGVYYDSEVCRTSRTGRRAFVRQAQHCGYCRRGAPQSVRLHRRLRAAHARRPAQCIVHRLHRHAGRAYRQEYPRGVRRVHKHLRHPAGGGGQGDGADLLREPSREAGAGGGGAAEDRP